MAKAALEKQAATGTNTFVIGQNVDNANSRQTENAEPNPYPGYSITPPPKR